MDTNVSMLPQLQLIQKQVIERKQKDGFKKPVLSFHYSTIYKNISKTGTSYKTQTVRWIQKTYVLSFHYSIQKIWVELTALTTSEARNLYVASQKRTGSAYSGLCLKLLL